MNFNSATKFYIIETKPQTILFPLISVLPSLVIIFIYIFIYMIFTLFCFAPARYISTFCCWLCLSQVLSNTIYTVTFFKELHALHS